MLPADPYDLTKAKLAKHYSKHVNVTFERSQFQGLTRNEGESFECFAARLRLHATRCGYERQQRDDTILQCAVSRCRYKNLQMKLFRTPNLTLSAAVQFAAEEEATRALVSELNALPPPSQPVVRASADSPPGQLHAVSGVCWRCRSRRHEQDVCPFRSARCFACSRRGHTRAACSSGRRDREAPGAAAAPWARSGQADGGSAARSPAGAELAAGGGTCSVLCREGSTYGQLPAPGGKSGAHSGHAVHVLWSRWTLGCGLSPATA